jgi:hypothetical protein
MAEKVTQNFSYNEFRPNGSPDTWMPNSDYQKLLIVNLAQNLQVVRSSMPNGCSIAISCGARLQSDFKRLSDLGYHPSETSDHYCANVIPIDPSSSKYKKFGPYYFLSVGAADTVPNGMSIDSYFKLAISLTMQGKCRFGQVIHEIDPVQKKEWVHFSNDYSIFFSPTVVNFLGKTKFMTTTDGGKTYVPYIPS